MKLPQLQLSLISLGITPFHLNFGPRLTFVYEEGWQLDSGSKRHPTAHGTLAPHLLPVLDQLPHSCLLVRPLCLSNLVLGYTMEDRAGGEISRKGLGTTVEMMKPTQSAPLLMTLSRRVQNLKTKSGQSPR